MKNSQDSLQEYVTSVIRIPNCHGLTAILALFKVNLGVLEFSKRKWNVSHGNVRKTEKLKGHSGAD